MDGVTQPAGGLSSVSWPSDSVALALRRLAAVLAGTWLAVEAYGVLVAPAGWFRWEWLALAALGVGMLSSVLVAARPSVPVQVQLVGVTVAALADCLLVQRRPDGGAGFVVYWLPGALACTAGFLLTERRAVAVAMATAAGSAALVLLRLVPEAGWSVAGVSAAASVCFTLCDGAAALLLARALRRVARAADDELTRARSERERAEQDRQERQAAFRLAAQLHDSVINTLAALVARGDVLDPVAVRRTCADTADVAARIAAAQDEGDPRHQVLRALAWDGPDRHLHYPQVRLTGATRTELVDHLSRLPAGLAGAVAGAVHEALTNVARHSGRSEADVAVRLDPALELTISDSGTGFDGSAPPGRGLALSVLERCRDAGVQVQLVTSPGRGTTLVLRCPAVDGECLPPALAGDVEEDLARLDVERLLRSVRAPFARQFSACLLALCAGLTLITPPGAGVWTSYLGLALVAAITVWGGRRVSESSWLEPTAVWVLAAAVIPIVVLPGLEAPGCDRIGTAWWGPDGALVPLAMLLFLSRAWWPVLLGMACFWGVVLGVAVGVQPQGCGLLAGLSGVLDSVVVLALAHFRVQLGRLAYRAAVANAQARASASASGLERSALRTRRAELSEALRLSGGLLRAVADRRLDPVQPEVRYRCAMLENHLRQLSQLPPGLDRLGPRLAEALASAFAAGVRLVIRLDEDDVPYEAAEALRHLLNAVLAGSGQGDTISLVALSTSGSPRITLTGPPMPLVRLAAAVNLAEQAGWQVTCTDLVEQLLIEMQGRPEWHSRTPATTEHRAAASASRSSTTTSSSATA